jgi:hypothetical protein
LKDCINSQSTPTTSLKIAKTSCPRKTKYSRAKPTRSTARVSPKNGLTLPPSTDCR